MKSFLLRFFVSIFLITLFSPVLNAQYNWSKDPLNPIFTGGGNGSWDYHSFQPCVIFNPDSNRYEMWYGGSYTPSRPYRIGFAWSTDGVNWTPYGGNPVLTPDPGTWDQESVEFPRVLYENGEYKMWYTGWSDITNYIFSIGYATSTDGINWTKHPDPVLTEGDSTWESISVAFCTVKPTQSGYIMYYTGFGPSTNGIGRAVSADGINWTRDEANNPVLSPGSSGQWDDYFVGSPDYVERNGTFYMVYGGWQGGMGGTRQAGLAISTNQGQSWTKYENNPILIEGSTGTWDGDYLESSCVMIIRDSIHLWYDGAGTINGVYRWKLGKAYSKLVDTIYVPQNFATIQAGIDAAEDDDVVLVDEGTYTENINFRGKAITVASRFFVDGDESHIQNTVIDGSQPSDPDSGSVVTFNSGEDTNSVICGFTITGGKGTKYLFNVVGKIGGGICAVNSGAKITHNIITSNLLNFTTDCEGAGLGLHSRQNLPYDYIIENNIIENNTINTPYVDNFSLGGGLYVGTNGYVRIYGNKISNNSITAPTAYGGGLEVPGIYNDNYFIANNIISDNSVISVYGGSGGIDIFHLSPTLIHNLIVNNSAPLGGGSFIEFAGDKSNQIAARYPTDGSSKNINKDTIPIFINNTIANNTASISGGGLEINAVIPEIINGILWGNEAPAGAQINGNADVRYSDVQGGYTGTGNADSDPHFRDEVNRDFHLMSTDCGDSYNSECIDAGDLYYNDFLLDCEWGLGDSRSDMGAYGGPNTIVGVVAQNDNTPTEYLLSQNYPNPFNPATTIRYSVPKTSKVQIKIYDVLGNEIKTLINEEKPAGTYEINWNAVNLPSGVYFYQIKAGEFTGTRKMILLK